MNIIDIKDALYRLQEDKELLVELIEIFLEDSSGRMTLVRESIDAREEKPLSEQAHTLKGAAGNISAKGLYEIFKELEHAAKDGDFIKAQQLHNKASEQIDILKDSLPALKDEILS